MSAKQILVGWLAMFLLAGELTGCAEIIPVDLKVSKMAEYADRRGQANVKLYMYSGSPKITDIRAYAEKQGCNMHYAYFYPDTVPLSEIPVEEINAAKSFADAREILFDGEGYARWRFSSQCLAVIPIVTDCNERFAGQNCR